MDAENGQSPDQLERLRHRRFGFIRKADHEKTRQGQIMAERRSNGLDHLVEIDLLLDLLEHLHGPALRRKGQGATARCPENLCDLIVECLGARSARHLPGDVQIARHQFIAELDNPSPLDDGRQVLEVEISHAILRDIALDFVDNELRRPRHPALGPHERVGTERTLIGATPGGQQRHRAADVHAVDLVAGYIILQREQVPGRARDRIDIPCARGKAIADGFRPVPVSDTADRRDGLALCHRLQDVDDGLLTLAQHDDIER